MARRSRTRNPDLSALIEAAVQRGEKSTVKRLVPEWLEAEDTVAARLQASEWLRRIAETSSAIRALGISKEFLTWDKLTADRARLQLQLARLLNAWGASSTALELLASVPVRIVQESSMAAAGILLTNYRYPEAVAALRAALKQQPKNAFAKILLARALQGLSLEGKNHWAESDEVLTRLEREHAQEESSLSAVAAQTLASNAILRGELRLAAACLERMEARRESLGDSVDAGNGWKWRLALHALRGESAAGQAAFQEAWKRLWIRGEKPELWTELYYWMGLLERTESTQFPASWSRLEAYPGGIARARAWVRREWREARLPETVCFGPENLPVWDCESWDWSRPELIVCALLAAGEGGVPQYRLSEVLWPGEAYSVFTWQKRIENLVLRARTELKAEIEWSDYHLTLKRARHRVEFERAGLDSWRPRSRRASELRSRLPSVSLAELMQVYGVSSRTATRILKAWKG